MLYGYTVDTCSMPSIEFYENLWTIIQAAMSILVVQNDPGFVSNHWVWEYLLPTPAFPGCVFDSKRAHFFQGSLLWRLRTGKWYGAKDRSSAKKQLCNILPTLTFVCFPNQVPLFLRSTSPHHFWPPGRLEGFHQLDLSDEESARQPTAMLFEYTTYVCMQPWVGVETSTFVETWVGV